MNEFLRSLKASQDKRRGSRRKYQDGGTHNDNGNLKRKNADNEGPSHSHAAKSKYVQSLLVEVLPVFQNLFEGIIENQSRMLDIEEKKLQNIKNCTECLKNIMTFGSDNMQNFSKLISSVNTRAPGKKKYAKKVMSKERKQIFKTVIKMRKEGATYDNIALHLDKEKVPTFSGRGKWHAQTIHRLLQDND